MGMIVEEKKRINRKIGNWKLKVEVLVVISGWLGDADIYIYDLYV